MIKNLSFSHSFQQTAKSENWLPVGNYAPASFEDLATKIRLNNNNKLIAAQSAEVFYDLFPFLEVVSLKSGKFLYQSGDQIEYLYFPETAVVSEFQILADGRTIETVMIGNEGVTGIIPIFDSCLAMNWTQVSIGGNAARIERQIFERIFFRHFSFQKLLLKFVNSHVRQISQRSVCNSYHLIEQRFCSWLLMLQNRHNHNRLALTQEQIARALGVHRPSVTLIAKSLRTKKIIDYVRGNIYILDRGRLEKSACRCFSEIDKSSSNSYWKNEE